MDEQEIVPTEEQNETPINPDENNIKLQELIDQKNNLEKQLSDQEDTIEIQNERIGDLEGQYNTVKETLEDILKRNSLEINNNNNNNMTKEEEVVTNPVATEVPKEEVQQVEVAEVKEGSNDREEPKIEEPKQEKVPEKSVSKPEVDPATLSLAERLEKIEFAAAETAMEREIASAISVNPKATRESILSKLALGDSRAIADIAKDVSDSTIQFEKELREKILLEEKEKLEEQIRQELAGNKSTPQSQGQIPNGTGTQPRYATLQQKRNADWGNALSRAKNDFGS